MILRTMERKSLVVEVAKSEEEIREAQRLTPLDPNPKKASPPHGARGPRSCFA